jgi:transposase
MGKLSKRQSKLEEARPFAGVNKVHPKAAGVDLGAREIMVCVVNKEGEQLVRAFGTYTVDLKAIGQWLQEYGVESVAMESTGVYWIPLFEELEAQSFHCHLISSRSLRRVPGRKSDVIDCQWIQTLHSYGLLESSFRPEADLAGLRTLLRHRASLLRHRAPHILHMQKALLQMNIQLSQALSDVTGETGLRIIRAIVGGERDAHQLAAFRNYRCKKDEEEIAKALTGMWRREHVFVLQQALALYDFYTQQIAACDVEVEGYYAMIRAEWETGALPELPEGKRKSHSKNAPQVTEARKHLKRIAGIDITAVPGISVSLAQTIISEVGTDMRKFPNEKHFCSWLGLAPKKEISGGKVLKESVQKTRNRAGQAFRMAAGSVMRANCAFGGFYRRQKARLGPAQAAVATAHLIARVVYKMLKYKEEYQPRSLQEYERHYQEQQVKYLQKKAAKFGYQLLPT